MSKTIVEGPFGIKMTDTLAKEIDQVVKSLPKELRTIRRKQLAETPELVQGERCDISYVTRETMDREGEVILSKGCELSYFQTNPVVMFAHEYSQPPVGRCVWIKQVPGGLKAKTQYATRPDQWEGQWLPDALFALTQQQILKGKSVGILAKRMRPPSAEEKQWKGAAAIIEESILLEYSIAPIPMNAESLTIAVSKGLCDRETLARLGLIPRHTKAVDHTQAVIKALQRIDPAQLAREVMDQIKSRGRV